MEKYEGIMGGSITIDGDYIYGVMPPLEYTCTFDDLADVKLKEYVDNTFGVSLVTYAPGDVPHEVVFDDRAVAEELYKLLMDGQALARAWQAEALPAARRKPFYKRWWFIAACVVLVLGVAFSGGDNGSGSYAHAVYENETPAAEAPMSEVEIAHGWAKEELASWPHLSSPWSIRQRMINQGGFLEEIANEVLEMLSDFIWAERAFIGAEELAVSGQIGRNGLISELELGLHSPETISTVMQKIDELEIDWYEMAIKFIEFHGPTSGFMNHENMFRDWMINSIGFTESEAQHAYDGFRAGLEVDSP